MLKSQAISSDVTVVVESETWTGWIGNQDDAEGHARSEILSLFFDFFKIVCACFHKCYDTPTAKYSKVYMCAKISSYHLEIIAIESLVYAIYFYFQFEHSLTLCVCVCVCVCV
jgi:hypothetical protein